MNTVLEEQNMIRPIETIMRSPIKPTNRKSTSIRKRCVRGKHKNKKTNRCNIVKSIKTKSIKTKSYKKQT